MRQHATAPAVGLLALLLAATTACGDHDAAGDDDSAAAQGAAAPAAAATTASDAPAVGRCAVDVRDGAPYGKITAAEVDAGSGATTYTIEAPGGAATWHKNATGVKVVDCTTS